MKYLLKIHTPDLPGQIVAEFANSDDARVSAMSLRKNYPKGTALEIVENHGHGLPHRHYEAYQAIGVDPAEYRGADYGND